MGEGNPFIKDVIKIVEFPVGRIGRCMKCGRSVL